MSDEPSQEELLKQQKENCIFCKIIKGEIPSKKVYEDDVMIAILDINPAVKGHILVMPKEHYPIMPLIPPEEFAHLFGKTAELTGAVKDGLLTPRATVFIANGAIAGQQSPHFLFHIMPREDGDGLDMLAVEGKGINQSDLQGMLEKNLYAVMRQHLQKMNNLGLLQTGSVVEEPTQTIPSQEIPPPSEVVEEETPPQSLPPQQAPPGQEQLSVIANLLQQSPEIQELLEKNPEQLKTVIASTPELAKAFDGIDIDRLAASLHGRKPAHPAPEAPRTEEEPPAEAPVDPNADIVPARQMTLDQLFAYIDAKQRLKDLILHNPEELKEIIPTSERLTLFFDGSNVDAIIQAYQEYAKKEHSIHVTVEPEDKKDLPPAPPPKGPTRAEMEDAFETRDRTRDFMERRRR